MNHAIKHGKYIKPSYITEKRLSLHREMNGSLGLKVSDDEILLFWSLGRPVKDHASVTSNTVHKRRKTLGLDSHLSHNGNVTQGSKKKMLECLKRVERTECPEYVLEKARDNIDSLTVV